MAITPGLIALGDSVFHGKVAGGMCFGCHGVDGKGTPGLAPDLTSGKWLHGDGSYGYIIRIVQVGVPKPKVAAAPMPPMGGSKLGLAEVRAVAAYVFSLSHPKAPAGH
jgi:mono/diheme cytochrome c family protein